MLNIIRKLHTWLLARRLRSTGRTPAEVRTLIDRELAGIEENVRAFCNWQINEQAVLKERLARRYDIGMAMNESAQRALRDKEVAKNAPVLTDKQKAALAFQKDYLDRVVRKA
jgi:hypothetical protein